MHDRQLLSLVVGLLLISGAAHSETDVFMRAVGFALSGSDEVEVKAIDRANCVFAYQDNVFHLNNVHVDRINIQGWKNAVEQWTEVELHGDDVVVEHTYASTEPRPTKPVAYKQWKLNLKTHEVDRVSRAWQYIYSNGCIGKKSPF